MYFAVLFLDDNGRVPTLEPLVFIGRDLDPGDEGKLYFQDYGSYHGGVRFETASPDDEAIFHTGREKAFITTSKHLMCSWCARSDAVRNRG